MADPIEVVKGVLAGASAVTTLVSDRISPLPIAQGETLPAITMRVISTVPTTHLRGDGNLDSVRVQVDSYAASATAAAALSDAVRAALGAADRVLQNEFDDFDPVTETFVVSQDYLLWVHPTA